MGSHDGHARDRSLGCCATGTTVESMPAGLETQFALSAAPPGLRERATVYVLDPGKGYQLARRGTSGVTCIVQRTVWEMADSRSVADHFDNSSICGPSAGGESRATVQIHRADGVVSWTASSSGLSSLRTSVRAGERVGAILPPATTLIPAVVYVSTDLMIGLRLHHCAAASRKVACDCIPRGVKQISTSLFLASV